jgi:hypothetical protein
MVRVTSQILEMLCNCGPFFESIASEALIAQMLLKMWRVHWHRIVVIVHDTMCRLPHSSNISVVLWNPGSCGTMWLWNWSEASALRIPYLFIIWEVLCRPNQPLSGHYPLVWERPLISRITWLWNWSETSAIGFRYLFSICQVLSRFNQPLSIVRP